MTKSRTVSVLISIAIAVSAACYLLISGFDDTVVYYKTVDELLAEPERYSSRPVRINGRLLPDSVQIKPNTNEYRFKLTKRSDVVTVSYDGILPDTMIEGKDLVVQGVFDTQKHIFVASEILTKCPSKYEAEAVAID